MKKVIKSIIFLLILCIFFYNIINIFWLEKNSISYFYEEPKNSLDIAYIGSSTVFCHFNSVLAYDLYGFTTGILASPAQPFILTKYVMDECEKYQKPKLYIIDIYQLASELNKYYEEVNLRDVTDAMKFSRNRTNAIKAFLEPLDLGENNPNYKSGDNYINYEFSFLLYHNMWKHLSNKNFVGSLDLYKGFLCQKNSLKKI